MANEFDVQTQGAGTSAGAADDYASMIAGDDGEVAPRQVGFPLAPPFTHYVLHIVKADKRRARQGDGIGARAQVEVVEGVGDTAGMKFFDSGNILYGFVPSRMEGKPPHQKPMSDEDYAKKKKNRVNGFARIRQATQVAQSMPSALDDAAVDAWCAQFADGKSKPFIAEVRVERGSDGVERNRVIWESVAALNEPEKDRQGRETGKTAYEEAVAQIAAYNSKKANGASGSQAASLNPNG